MPEQKTNFLCSRLIFDGINVWNWKKIEAGASFKLFNSLQVDGRWYCTTSTGEWSALDRGPIERARLSASKRRCTNSSHKFSVTCARSRRTRRQCRWYLNPYLASFDNTFADPRNKNFKKYMRKIAISKYLFFLIKKPMNKASVNENKGGNLTLVSICVQITILIY